MEVTFRFYTQNMYPLGTIKCDTTSKQFKHLMDAGYGYQVTAQRRTGTNTETYNRLDTPGDFEKLKGIE
jgi:hypothetical protein